VVRGPLPTPPSPDCHTPGLKLVGSDVPWVCTTKPEEPCIPLKPHSNPVRYIVVGPLRVGVASRPVLVIAAAMLLMGLLLAPPLSGNLFALLPASAADSKDLWLLACTLVALGVALAVGRTRVWKTRVAAMALAPVLLIGAELTARFYAVQFASNEARVYLVDLERQAFPAETRYRAHPFMEYIGNPMHNRANNFGFPGDDFAYATADGTTRVACLGGSTTESGYPAQMEDYLNEFGAAVETHWEVFNFGLAGWTSTHSLLNLTLNVTDFDPAYVVIHHAWNDFNMRAEPCTRGDYLHSTEVEIECYTGPGYVDGWALHLSILYRWARERSLPRVRKWFPTRQPFTTKLIEPALCPEQDPLWIYERNMRSMVAIALAHGAKPVLTTQPYNTHARAARADVGAHFKQCNQFVRELAEEYGDQVLLVDLDEQMTGTHADHFIDLGHLDHEGRQIKAAKIGAVILRDLGTSVSTP
jgi:hypothetical protein